MCDKTYKGNTREKGKVDRLFSGIQGPMRLDVNYFPVTFHEVEL